MTRQQRRFGCAVCRRPLNAHQDRAGGVVYRHSLRAELTDHNPVPVPAERIPGGMFEACDFCGVMDTNLWLYETTDVVLPPDNPLAAQSHEFGNRWNACPVCAALLTAGGRGQLHARALATIGLPRGGPFDAAMRQWGDAVLAAVRPGRTLLLDGRHGTPPPLPDTMLPKIRDRLGTLLGPGNRLPGLPDRRVRAQIAAGLPVARLFAVDTDYTGMAIAAARSLPPIHLHVLDVPAPYGLLTWAHPVDAEDTIAMFWATSDTGALSVATHRALGTTITGLQLQRLREQAGWLVPTHATTLIPGHPIGAGHPAAVLVATWLLIAHRLSEQVPVPVDAPIRRAYTRSGRPVPEVRRVQLRPRNRPTDNPAPRDDDTDAPEGRRQPDHRWWVGAFVREQAHGPGHSLRRPVLVMPYVNGPAGKPVKASTTVRLLSTTRRRPDEYDPVSATPSPAADTSAQPDTSC